MIEGDVVNNMMHAKALIKILDSKFLEAFGETITWMQSKVSWSNKLIGVRIELQKKTSQVLLPRKRNTIVECNLMCLQLL